MIGKYAQKRLYDFINRPSLWCFSIVIFVAFGFCLLFNLVILNFSFGGEISKCLNGFPILCKFSYIGEEHGVDIKKYISYDPIDVVYTWVNGSDPQFLSDLEKYLHESTGKDDSVPECKLDRCIPFSAIVVNKKLETSLTELQNLASCLEQDDGLAFEEEQNINLIYIAFTTIRNESTCISTTDQSLDIRPGCLTSSMVEELSASHPFAFYVSSVGRLGSFKDEKSLRDVLPPATRNYLSDMVLNINEDYAVLFYLTVNNREDAETALREQIAYQGETMTNIIPAFIVDCRDILSTSPINIEAKPKRFIDNEELKFSLRSLDKYMPWVRHVFVVTNGQIPNWLNVENERLTLISHDDIFGEKAKAALPTFSSPAIESQLLNIPNLANRFIYFNDDFFLGQTVYPEDFITLASGQKFYLTYSLPNCASGCPHTWIRDGFCDKPCNNSGCDFDGGDCQLDANATTPPVPLHPLDFQIALERAFCSQGCSNAWIADGFCDGFCNVPACAFDAGDCGVAGITNPTYEFFTFTLSSNASSLSTSIYVPKQQYVIVGNLSAVISPKKTFKMGKCTTEVTPALRTSSFISNHSLFILLAFRNNNLSTHFVAECELSFESEISVNFTLTFGANDPVVSLWENKTDIFEIEKPKIVDLSSDVHYFNRFKRRNNLVFIIRLCPRFIRLAHRFLFQFHSRQLTSYGFGIFLMKLVARSGKSCRKRDMERVFIDIRNTTLKIEKTVITPPKTKLRVPGLMRGSVIMSRFRPRSPNPAVRSSSNTSDSSESLPPDAYSASLLHVNKLFNRDFGYAQRKIPAHVPLLIDRDVFNDLYSRYQNEWLATASRRFRSNRDMQLQFSYIYYVMSATLADRLDGDSVVDSIFRDEIDTDETGDLNVAEFRNLLLRAKGASAFMSSFQSWRQLAKQIARSCNCFENVSHFLASYYSTGTEEQFEARNNSFKKHFLTISDAKACWPVREMFELIAKRRQRFKFEAAMTDDDSAVFRMLQSNVIAVESWLTSLRRNPPKFICLNDDMDHSEPLKSETRQILTKVGTFLRETYPKRSQFELPPNYRNRFSKISDLRSFQIEEARRKAVRFYLLVVVTSCLILLSVLRWRRLFQKLWRFICFHLFSKTLSECTRSVE